MQYIKLTNEDYKTQNKFERKQAHNKQYKPKKPVDTTNGIVHHKLFYVFLFGSIIGTVYEEILMLCLRGYWTPRTGVFWLPLNPLYGFGFVAFVLVLSKFDKWYHQIVYGSLLGGSVEYFSHFLQQLITGTRSWDYTNKITNIDGRTTVIYAFFWGVLGFLLVKFLYPQILKLLRIIPYKVGEGITLFLKILVFSVIAISFTAVFRCQLKSMGYKPLTPIGKFYDKYFPKSYIKKYYTNMRFK